MNKLIALIACSLVTGYTFAQQKRPLDVKACTSWNRIDNPRLSPTGRYVTYKIVPTERGYSDSDKIPTVLYDSKTGKKCLELRDVDNFKYFNQDRQLSCTQTDSTGKTLTYILDLPSGKKTLWQHPEPLAPIKGSQLSAALVKTAEDKAKNIKSHDNLVVRNLKTKDTVCIENIVRYDIFNEGRDIVFMQDRDAQRQIMYGAVAGPYKVLLKGEKKAMPTYFNFDPNTLTGRFDIKDSLYCRFSLKHNSVDTVLCVDEIPVAENMKIARISLTKNPNYVMLEIGDKADSGKKRKKPTRKKDDSFELELWTWDEKEVPTLQTASTYRRAAYDKYIYNRKTHELVKIAPVEGNMLMPYRELGDVSYLIYTDETPYLKQKEWREKIPFDVYAVDIHTGQSRLIGKECREQPKWSPTGRWVMMYDSHKKNWNKFDANSGAVSNVSADIPYPVYDETYDKPAPAPSYGIAGWTADGKYVMVRDAYDWWKIALDGSEKTVCMTRGNGRSSQISYRILYSNMDKEVFGADEKVYVLGVHHKDMSQSICQIDMKGNVRTLMHGDYMYNIKAFSENHKYCLWTRQNVSTYPDLCHSTATFTDIKRVTDANPQQKQYVWGSVKIVEWKNYEGKQNRGLLYLPEDYDSKQTYPVIVQFYETHTEEKNHYVMPLLSSAMANATYAMSNGYIVFMPDVHFTIGSPGQSTYDAVVSGVDWLVGQGIAHKGKIGLQGHSWSGYQTTYLVTKTDIFDCAQIGAPITDMVTGYLGIRNGSGLPRYFMYEDTQSRMGATLWNAKEQYRAMSPIINADRIHTPLLIFHNDNDEAVAYEHGRALYLAMRRLQRPAWMVNYKGEGHFVMKPAAQKDWTIRMMQFFDHYLKGTKEPRWMKEGIHLRDRGYDQKYDLVK